MKQAIEVTLNKAQMADIKKAIKQNSVSVSHDIKELRKQIDRLNYRLNDIHQLMLTETDTVDEDVVKVVKYDGIEHNSEYDDVFVSGTTWESTGNNSAVGTSTSTV